MYRQLTSSILNISVELLLFKKVVILRDRDLTMKFIAIFITFDIIIIRGINVIVINYLYFIITLIYHRYD